MEEVAQGRVWTGKAAKERGLVDTIGGFSKAIAIAKQKAGISQETKVSLVELSKRSPSLSDVLRSGVITVSVLMDIVTADKTLQLFDSFLQGRALLEDLSAPAIQARMENVIIEGSGDLSTLSLVSDILKGNIDSIQKNAGM